jgi:hypothetical protein
VRTVSRQVQRASKAQVEIRAPKHGSERVVFLPEDLVNMLAAHVEGGVRPEGRLFVGVNDGPPHQNTVGYWWRKTLRDVGLNLWPTAEDRTRKAARAMMTAVLGDSADSVRTEAPKTASEQRRSSQATR